MDKESLPYILAWEEFLLNSMVLPYELTCIELYCKFRMGSFIQNTLFLLQKSSMWKKALPFLKWSLFFLYVLNIFFPFCSHWLKFEVPWYFILSHVSNFGQIKHHRLFLHGLNDAVSTSCFYWTDAGALVCLCRYLYKHYQSGFVKHPVKLVKANDPWSAFFLADVSLTGFAGKPTKHNVLP